jgi:hypothetical protein
MNKKPADKTTDAVDLGPKERLQHGAHRLERTRSGVRLRNVDGSALDALYYRDIITQDEHTAGSRLMVDCLLARMMGPPGFNSEATTRSQYSNIPDTVAKAIDRINEAMAHVAKQCGRQAEVMVIPLLTRDALPRDLPALRRALSALAEHYYRPKKRYRFDLT